MLVMDLAGELAGCGVAVDVAVEVFAVRKLHDSDSDHPRSSAGDVAVRFVFDIDQFASACFNDGVCGVVGDLVDERLVVFWIGDRADSVECL